MWWVPLATMAAGAYLGHQKDKKNSESSKKAEAEARAHNAAAARMKYITDFETRPYVQGQEADPTGSMMQGALAGFAQGQQIQQDLDRYGKPKQPAAPNTFQGYTPPEQAYQNPTKNAILDESSWVGMQNSGSGAVDTSSIGAPNSYQDPLMKANSELMQKEIADGYDRSEYYNSNPGVGKAQTNFRMDPNATREAANTPYFLMR